MYLENLSDIASERAVLSGIFKYGSDAYVDIADIINANAFTDLFNQCLYKCYEYLLKDEGKAQIDLASIIVAAERVGVATEINHEENRNLLRAVTNFPIELDNVRKMAAKIRKLQIARLLQNELDSAKNNVGNITGDETIPHILGLAEKPVFDFTSLLNDAGTNGPENMGDGVEEYVKFLEENERDMAGIPTGYSKHDMAIGGGLRPGTVNIIASRAKQGKTQLVDNMGTYIAGKLKVPCLNLDTEMTKEDHWNRILANLSGVPVDNIELGKFKKPEDRKKVYEAAKYLKSIPYSYVSIAGQPFEDTLALMRRWVVKTVGLNDAGYANPCVIFFDYLKLMSSEGISKNMQETQLLGFLITGLHNFMVRYKIPCQAFAQLNRDGINKEDTDTIGGSDRFLWFCSSLCIYKPKTAEEVAEDTARGKTNYNRKMVYLASRHGKGLDDGDYLNMIFDGSLGRITEGLTRNELYSEQQQESSGFSINDEDADTVF